MYISEIKLRKIVRDELLNENYVPKKAYDESVYHIKGSEENKVKLQYLGSPSKGNYYFKNIGKTKTGKEVPNNEFNLKLILSAINKLYGREISSSHKEKLKKALTNNRIIKLTSFNNLHDSVKYQGATTFDKADMIYDTVADTVGAAAGLFGTGGMVLGAKVNAAQAAKKIAQEKYVDGTISALGAIPIPGAQQTVVGGFKNVAIFKTAIIKGGKEFLRKGGANIVSLIKGMSDLIDTIKSKKEIIINFIKEDILPLAKITPAGVVLTKIGEALDKIIKDIQDIVDSLK